MSGCIGLGSKGGSGVGGDGPLSKHRVVTHSWWNWRLVTPVSGSWSSIRGLMAWRSAVSTKQPRPPAFDEVQGPRRNSQAAHGVCLAQLCFAAWFIFLGRKCLCWTCLRQWNRLRSRKRRPSPVFTTGSRWWRKIGRGGCDLELTETSHLLLWIMALGSGRACFFFRWTEYRRCGCFGR